MDEWLPDLGGSELKVLLYLIRRTFGFHRHQTEVGLRAICNGVPGKDHGTGLHIETASAAIKSLEEKGILLAKREPGGRTIYTLPVWPAIGKSEHLRSENPNTMVYGKSEHEERKVTSERKLKSSSPSPPSTELVRTTAEEDEENRPYTTFKRLYPSHRFDEGKTRPVFEQLSRVDQIHVIQRLRVYLHCPRWLASIAEDDGRYIPLAFNWLKSYDADPPPRLKKTRDEKRRQQAESILRVAELTRTLRRETL
jgi:hypothetical protein